MGWIHYTNEAKRKSNRTKEGKRKTWINSRWSWFIGKYGNKSIDIQITSTPNFGWGIEFDGSEGEVSFRFWLLLKFYINFQGIFAEWVFTKEYNSCADKEKNPKENKKLRGKQKTKEKGWIRTATRELSLSFHNYSMWWDIWNDSSVWTRDTKKWRHGSIDFQKLLKGKDKVKNELVFEKTGEIQMPEGKYLCKINKKHYKRTYQRWFSKEWDRFEFKFGYDDNGEWIQTPIPHWGKGENSYDCGMDGTYSISLSSEVDNLEDAQKNIIKSFMRDRKRYGSIDFSKISGIEDGVVKKNLIGEF